MDNKNLKINIFEPLSIQISISVFLAILFLLIMHIGGLASSEYLGAEHFVSRQLIKLFHFDAEHNIPSWFSSVLLWTCGLALISVAFIENKKKLRQWLPWLLLGFLFFLLSMDESVALHEWMIIPMREIVRDSNVFYFAWIIPGFIFVILTALLLIPFMLKLPVTTLKIFIISGSVFIIGALGFEMIGGYISSFPKTNSSSLDYFMIMTLEELFEMIGLVMFLHGISSFTIAISNSSHEI